MGACCSSTEHQPSASRQVSHGRRRRKDQQRSGAQGRHVSRRSGGAHLPAVPGAALGPAGTAGTSLPHHHARPPPLLVAGSVMSGGEDDYHSCKEDFSVECTPCHSAHGSPPGTPGLHRRSGNRLGGAQRAQPPHQPSTSPQVNGAHKDSLPAQASGSGSEYGSDAYEDSQGEADTGAPGGCLNLIEALSHRLAPSSPDGDAERNSLHRSKARTSQAGVAPCTTKPNCGCSLTPRDPAEPEACSTMSYEDGDACHYNIRGLDYMKTKAKVPSETSFYQLVAADMITFDKKQNHIAELVNLPPVPPARHRMAPGSDACFPPLLIINVQLPTYAPSIWGGTDGPGWSIVWYFKLKDDFDPVSFPNQKALALYRRLVLNGKEADGSATRDRFKIIPRAVNVDEWAVKAPLSAAEHKLLSTYNEKPVLSRPQHSFIHTDTYFEIDLDIHTYSYIARSALMSFMSRLAGVVFEIAFVIQGNSADELPEQLLACGRIYRSDFAKARPFNSFLPDQACKTTSAANDKA